MSEVLSVELCTGSWYGHPESHEVEMQYHQANARAMANGQPCVGDEWRSPLVCWNLIGVDGLIIGRAYAPTEKTPRWVYTGAMGRYGIDPPLSFERLTMLLVSFCLREGCYVDALHF